MGGNVAFDLNDNTDDIEPRHVKNKETMLKKSER